MLRRAYQGDMEGEDDGIYSMEEADDWEGRKSRDVEAALIALFTKYLPSKIQAVYHSFRTINDENQHARFTDLTNLLTYVFILYKEKV